MDLIVLLTCLGTGITVIAFVYGFLRNFKIDIKEDIKTEITNIKTEMADIKTTISNLENDIRKDVRAQTSRTDKLYEMFVQLNKENNELIRALLKQPRTDP